METPVNCAKNAISIINSDLEWVNHFIPATGDTQRNRLFPQHKPSKTGRYVRVAKRFSSTATTPRANRDSAADHTRNKPTNRNRRCHFSSSFSSRRHTIRKG
jgi:hypothetical protein